MLSWFFSPAAWNYEPLSWGKGRKTTRSVKHSKITGRSLVHWGNVGHIPLNQTEWNCHLAYEIQYYQWCFQNAPFNVMQEFGRKKVLRKYFIINFRSRRYSKQSSLIPVKIMSVSWGFALELVPLRGEKNSSHAHKTGFWSLWGVLFKISNEHLPPLYLGVFAPAVSFILRAEHPNIKTQLDHLTAALKSTEVHGNSRG